MPAASSVGTWNGARREMEEDGWLIVRTLNGGTKAMRKAGDTLTPRTEAEHKDPERYKSRLKRSSLYPAYTETVEKIAALPFQKEPTVNGDLPDRIARIVEDADRDGRSLAVFAKRIYQDAIDRGMGLFIVDNMPVAPGTPLPDVERDDLRPYFTRIEPDNLIGFQTSQRNGRDVVTELRYREWSWRPNAEGTGESLVDRVKVWSESIVQIWERTTQATVTNRDTKAGQSSPGNYTLVREWEHGFEGGIPLIVVYTKQVAPLEARPPLLELAYLNVTHWNSQSMQRDALHYCRVPILKIAGASQNTVDQRPVASPGATIADTSQDLDVSFVEIAGTSLQAGERDIETLRQQMEALGMHPLIATSGPQTATGEIRADQAEKSKAQSWVEALEWAIWRAFQFASQWINEPLPEDFAVTLFKDSSLIAGRAQDLPVLERLFTLKAITRSTWLREVKARGVLVTVDNVDDEIAAVDSESEASSEAAMNAMAERMKQEEQEKQEEQKPPQNDPNDENKPEDQEDAA